MKTRAVSMTKKEVLARLNHVCNTVIRTAKNCEEPCFLIGFIIHEKKEVLRMIEGAEKLNAFSNVYLCTDELLVNTLRDGLVSDLNKIEVK